jgi:hypothetical protein
MRSIIFFLASIFLLFLLITCMGLFFPARVTVSRAIDVRASRATVYRLLSDPAQWKQWFPDAQRWTLITKEDQAVGINTPNGNSLMIDPQTDSTIVVKGLQAASIDGDMGFRLIGRSSTDVTTVQWYMNFMFDWYPWERFSSLLLEKKFGAVMEHGLRQLQAYAQSEGATN